MSASLIRSDRVAERMTAVLAYLVEHGPSVIKRIAAALVLAAHLVRFALVQLKRDDKVHIAEFERVKTTDHIPRYVAVFKAGPGADARLPFREEAAEERLNFESTLHLQGIYQLWASTREPEEIPE